MYLKSLRLENIACFEELDLDFTDENGDPCKWVVLLGENGTGKSTILQGIMGALGIPFFPKIQVERDVDIDRDMRRFYSVNIVPTDGDDFEGEFLEQTVAWSYGRYVGGYRGDLRGNEYYEKITGKARYGWFISGYGVKRRLKLDDSDPEFGFIPNALPGKRMVSLLGQDEKMTPPKVWFSSLDYEHIKLKQIEKYVPELVDSLQGPRVVEEYSNEEKEKARIRIARIVKEYWGAMRAIQSVLPSNAKFSRINPDKSLIFIVDGVEVPMDYISEGYQTTIAWVCDLVRNLCDAFPDSEDPLYEKGVVLVDEIDLHLHPRWQRTIVKQIRETFPNLQFIVTSHSPFVAQDMTEKDKIIVLTRDGDKVTARHEKGFVKGWRADQILTSWLFGLETSRDEEIESLEKERRIGLQRAEDGLLTDAERLELDRVTGELEAMRSSDVAPDRQKLEAAANLVMELMSKAL